MKNWHHLTRRNSFLRIHSFGDNHMRSRILIVAKICPFFDFSVWICKNWIKKRGKVFFLLIHWHIWMSFVVTKSRSGMSLFIRWQMYKSRSDEIICSLCSTMFSISKWCPKHSSWSSFRKIASPWKNKLEESYKLFFFSKHNGERHKWHTTNSKTNKSSKLSLNSKNQITLLNRWKIICLFWSGQPKCWLYWIENLQRLKSICFYLTFHR